MDIIILILRNMLRTHHSLLVLIILHPLLCPQTPPSQPNHHPMNKFTTLLIPCPSLPIRGTLTLHMSSPGRPFFTLLIPRSQTTLDRIRLLPHHHNLQLPPLHLLKDLGRSTMPTIPLMPNSSLINSNSNNTPRRLTRSRRNIIPIFRLITNKRKFLFLPVPPSHPLLNIITNIIHRHQRLRLRITSTPNRTIINPCISRLNSNIIRLIISISIHHHRHSSSSNTTNINNIRSNRNSSINKDNLRDRR
jgi:hypothetical protein